ncbi:MAG TPA: hypothetical protein VGQ55_12815 [Pyrinomonadaceae bacterium]|jgi:hypothetical protein|nr:hypothetical protein [Pyrinomonadaceae bacterium]
MVESLGLLAAVVLLVIVRSHDFAQIFLEEKDTRAYWFQAMDRRFDIYRFSFLVHPNIHG